MTHVLFSTRWGPHIVRPSRPYKFLLALRLLRLSISLSVSSVIHGLLVFLRLFPITLLAVSFRDFFISSQSSLGMRSSVVSAKISNLFSTCNRYCTFVATSFSSIRSRDSHSGSLASLRTRSLTQAPTRLWSEQQSAPGKALEFVTHFRYRRLPGYSRSDFRFSHLENTRCIVFSCDVETVCL